VVRGAIARPGACSIRGAIARRAGAIGRAFWSGARGAGVAVGAGFAVGAVIASISLLVRSRDSPGRSLPSSIGPMRTRTKRVTFNPTALDIRRTWRFHPVSRTIAIRERLRDRDRTRTRTARAMPSSRGIPR
jgi:hypothetical protein